MSASLFRGLVVCAVLGSAAWAAPSSPDAADQRDRLRERQHQESAQQKESSWQDRERLRKDSEEEKRGFYLRMKRLRAEFGQKEKDDRKAFLESVKGKPSDEKRSLTREFDLQQKSKRVDFENQQKRRWRDFYDSQREKRHQLQSRQESEREDLKESQRREQ